MQPITEKPVTQPAGGTTAAGGACSFVAPAPQLVRSERLLSVDALRGFDMFWLLGGEQIVHGLCAGAAAGTFAWTLDQQFEHVEWAGFHFYDFIFPLFLFLIGVAIPLSVDKRLARGESRRVILRHAFLRFCGMVVIGFFTTGNLHSWNIQRMGLSYSVLMMLGFGYLIAVALVLYTSLRTQIFTTAGILVGYWALQMFVAGARPRTGRVQSRRHLQRLGLRPHRGPAGQAMEEPVWARAFPSRSGRTARPRC